MNEGIPTYEANRISEPLTERGSNDAILDRYLADLAESRNGRVCVVRAKPELIGIEN